MTQKLKARNVFLKFEISPELWQAYALALEAHGLRQAKAVVIREILLEFVEDAVRQFPSSKPLAAALARAKSRA